MKRKKSSKSKERSSEKKKSSSYRKKDSRKSTKTKSRSETPNQKNQSLQSIVEPEIEPLEVSVFKTSELAEDV